MQEINDARNKEIRNKKKEMQEINDMNSIESIVG